MIFLLPHSFPTSHVVSHSQSTCVSPAKLTDGRDREGVGEEPNNTTPRKPGPLHIIQYSLRTIHVKDKEALDMTGVFLTNRTRDKLKGHVSIPPNPSSQMLVKQESLGEVEFKVGYNVVGT
jgi:hypothetical protein